MIPLIDITPDKKTGELIKKEVNKVVDSGSYILGKRLASFESKFAKYIGSSSSIGVANGTQALSLCLRALGIGRGDKVLTVSFSSPFTAISIVEEGAEPVFCDVDEKTWTLDILDCAKKIDRRVKAIMPVHIFGNPCNMHAILKFAGQNKLKVIEDACQAHGASIGNKKMGTFGDAAGFSFYPTKNLGAMGDAGAITTNNIKLAKMARLLRHGGQTRRFWHQYSGTNSRLDEIQAAILEIKLKNLANMQKKRTLLAARYFANLSQSNLAFQGVFERANSACHLFVIRAKNRDKLKSFLESKEIGCGIYYPFLIHKQPAFKKYKSGKLPVSEKLSREIIAIPISPTLTFKDQDYIIEQINNFYSRKK